MTQWIVRCANPRCRHVCHESDWILKPKENPTEADIKLRTQQTHCPKCDCKSFYKANAKESAAWARRQAAIY